MKTCHFTAEDYVDSDTGCRYQLIDSQSCISDPMLHDHDYYELFLTLGDKTPHLVNGTQQFLPRGSLVFIRPFDSHYYNLKYPFLFINLSLSAETINQLFSYLSPEFHPESLLECPLPPIVQLTETETEAMFGEIRSLNTLNTTDSPQLKYKIRIILFNLFTKYFGPYRTPNPSDTAPAWLITLMNEMCQYDNFYIGASRMIELSNRSHEHLSRLIKQHYNITIAEYVNDLRINYVANLLIHSNIPILDLFFESGINNVSWGYVLFKKKFGVSPAKFRQLKSQLNLL